MIEIWMEGRKPVKWQSWGEGPITVARPPIYLRSGSPPVPNNERWAIYHRKTGRELATGLNSGNRADFQLMARAVLDATPASFWAAFRDAELGDPFELPARYLGDALAAFRPALRGEALKAAQELRSAAESLIARLSSVDVTRAQVSQIRRLRSLVGSTHNAL